MLWFKFYFCWMLMIISPLRIILQPGIPLLLKLQVHPCFLPLVLSSLNWIGTVCWGRAKYKSVWSHSHSNSFTNFRKFKINQCKKYIFRIVITVSLSSDSIVCENGDSYICRYHDLFESIFYLLLGEVKNLVDMGLRSPPNPLIDSRYRARYNAHKKTPGSATGVGPS